MSNQAVPISVDFKLNFVELFLRDHEVTGKIICQAKFRNQSKVGNDI